MVTFLSLRIESFSISISSALKTGSKRTHSSLRTKELMKV